MKPFTHFNRDGEARMVDVGSKPPTHRVARAEGVIRMRPETLDGITRGAHDKGDVLGIARVAGIMAAKKTPDLIPLCHPLLLSRVEVALTPEPDQCRVHCHARVESTGPTGVEMEALQAAQTALLTIYDMCKSVDRGMTIDGVRLVEKSGGKSGRWTRDDA